MYRELWSYSQHSSIGLQSSSLSLKYKSSIGEYSSLMRNERLQVSQGPTLYFYIHKVIFVEFHIQYSVNGAQLILAIAQRKIQPSYKGRNHYGLDFSLRTML